MTIQAISCRFKRRYQAEAKYVYKILIKFGKISEDEVTYYKMLLRSLLVLELLGSGALKGQAKSEKLLAANKYFSTIRDSLKMSYNSWDICGVCRK